MGRNISKLWTRTTPIPTYYYEQLSPEQIQSELGNIRQTEQEFLNQWANVSSINGYSIPANLDPVTRALTAFNASQLPGSYDEWNPKNAPTIQKTSTGLYTYGDEWNPSYFNTSASPETQYTSTIGQPRPGDIAVAQPTVPLFQGHGSPNPSSADWLTQLPTSQQAQLMYPRHITDIQHETYFDIKPLVALAQIASMGMGGMLAPATAPAGELAGTGVGASAASAGPGASSGLLPITNTVSGGLEGGFSALGGASGAIGASTPAMVNVGTQLADPAAEVGGALSTSEAAGYGGVGSVGVAEAPAAGLAGPTGAVEPVAPAGTPPTEAPAKESFLDKLTTRLGQSAKMQAVKTGLNMVSSPPIQQPTPGFMAYQQPESALAKLASVPVEKPAELAELDLPVITAPQKDTSTAPAASSVAPTPSPSQLEQEQQNRFRVRQLEDYLRQKVAERERKRRARFIA